MKNCKKLKFLAGAAALTLAVGLASTDASATNGYFAHGYSIKSKAMAGVGVALPEDTLAATTNPAGMVEVGKRYDAGVSFFMPTRSYNVKTPGGLPLGKVESDNELFVIPALGGNWMLNDMTSLGVSIFGNGGMNTDYNAATYANFGGGNTGPTGVDLMQLFVMPTYSKKVSERHSWGISPIFGYQKFEAQGLQSFGGAFSSSPTNLTNKGYDTAYGYGLRVGYMGNLTPELAVGLSLQSKIYMGEFDDYKGLFAEQGDMDIPANWTVGFSYKMNPKVTFAVDVQKILYSGVDAVSNQLLLPTGGILGANDGSGFGWEDMTVVKLGTRWQYSEDLTLRAGLSHGSQPIPESQIMFNMVAPGVIETHATLGMTKKIGDSQEFDIAVMRAFNKSITGVTPAAFGSQTVELAMDQWEVSLGYSWKF